MSSESGTRYWRESMRHQALALLRASDALCDLKVRDIFERAGINRARMYLVDTALRLEEESENMNKETTR